MTGSSNLRLHPWRDSVEHCLRLLEASPSPKSVAVPVTREPVVSSIRRGQLTHESNARHNVLIRSVDLCFHETDYQAGVSNKINLVELFEAIAQLPNLESLIVRLTATASTFPHPPNGIPPLEALNIVLGSSTQLGYLTLIGLPLFADDFDMNGCVELLRIHPALHSIVVKDCLFASPHHLEQMKSATKKRKHVDYLNNVVVDVTTLPKEDVKPWYQSFFSTCFLGCMLLMALYFLVVLLKDVSNTDGRIRQLIESGFSFRLLSYFGLQKPPMPPKKVKWWKRLFRRP